jgi:hypothetical protein
VSENYAVVSNSWISTSLSITNETYYSLRNYYSYFAVPNGDLYPYVSLIFIMDDEVTTVSRTVMTLADALSNTGGILGFIYVSFHLIIMKLQEFLY